jgi:hypothetical protein
MTQASIKTVQRLDIPLDKADGELLYCIRQANPEQRFWGRSEPSRNSIRYALSQQDTDLIGAGDAGSILLWSAGDQTYLERTPAPQPTEREALAYILARWFRKENRWPDQRSRSPEAAGQLVESILNHVAGKHNADLVFVQQVPRNVLIEFCTAIRVMMASALGHDSGQDLNLERDELRFLILPILYKWASNRNQKEPESQAGVVQRVRRKLEDWWMTDDESQSLQFIKKLSPAEQTEYGFSVIQARMQECIQVVYRSREAYQDQLIRIFLERMETHSMEQQKNGVILEKNAPPCIQKSMPLWLQIEDRGQERELLRFWLENMPAKEIALTLHISKDRVYNIVSDLRRHYGEAFVPYRDEKRRHKPPT